MQLFDCDVGVMGGKKKERRGRDIVGPAKEDRLKDRLKEGVMSELTFRKSLSSNFNLRALKRRQS